MPQPRAKHVPDDPEIGTVTQLADPGLRLCLILMSDAGCRLREALAFDVSSLTANNLLRVWASKSKKWRTVPVTKRLKAAINDLATASLATMYPRWVQRRYDEIQQAAGYPKTSPHRLRHSYATRLYLEGVPAHVIMQLMGHSKLITTLAYIHGDDDTWELAAAALDRRAARG